MKIKDKYIVFDTNMWIKILSNDGKINRTLLSDLQKQNQFGMYNISLIEILMKFYRENNLVKIKEILKYIDINIKNGCLIIGNIYCSNFYIENSEISKLMAKTDEEILLAIEELKKARFEFKSSIIALWIIILLELFCTISANDEEHFNNIVLCCGTKAKQIQNTFVEYFYNMENGNVKKIKNLRSITNKVFKEVLNEVAKEADIVDNKHYNLMQNMIDKLKPYQSISYIFKGFYDSEVMSVYKNRIDESLDLYFNSKSFKEIFYARLKAFMQGECLQRNDVEDMLMLSVLEINDNIVLVTDDNKMRDYIKNDRYELGNKIHDSLINKNTI